MICASKRRESVFHPFLLQPLLPKRNGSGFRLIKHCQLYSTLWKYLGHFLYRSKCAPSQSSKAIYIFRGYSFKIDKWITFESFGMNCESDNKLWQFIGVCGFENKLAIKVGNKNYLLKLSFVAQLNYQLLILRIRLG